MRITWCLASWAWMILVAIATLFGALATADAQGRWEPSVEFPILMGEAMGVAAGGKFYVMQGVIDGGFTPLGVMYLLDEAGKTWIKKASMPVPAHHDDHRVQRENLRLRRLP